MVEVLRWNILERWYFGLWITRVEKSIEEKLSMGWVDRIVKKLIVPVRNESVDIDLIVSEFSSYLYNVQYNLSLINSRLQICEMADFSYFQCKRMVQSPYISHVIVFTSNFQCKSGKGFISDQTD